MPTYNYICENCGYEFEQFQSITANPLRKCPQCTRPDLKRLIGAGAGIIFKGSGFYQTDYRSESYKQAQKKEKPDADTTAKKDTKSKSTTESPKSPDKPKPDIPKKTNKDT